MDPKCELASVDIAAVVSELAVIEGAHLDKAYLYPEIDLLRFKLRHYAHGRQEVLAQVGDYKRLHLADPATVPDAPTRPPNFAKMLRNQLEHGQIASIEQLGFDRIAKLSVDVPDGTVEVLIECFGDGNVAVVGVDGTVVDCLRTVRLRSRTVQPGQPYEAPSQRINPFDLSFVDFVDAMEDSDSDVVRTLATQLNLGGRYAEELCTRADVGKTLAIDAIDESTLQALFDELTELNERITTGVFEPSVYSDEDGVVDVSPVALEELADFEVESFDTFSAAIDSYFQRLSRRRSEEADRDDVQQAERERLERIIDQQRQAIESYEADSTAQREKAELLYARYDLIDDLLETVHGARADGHDWSTIETRLASGAEQGIEAASIVRQVHPETGTIVIELDDHMIELEVGASVERNADRLYREAKEIAEKVTGAKEALAETEAELTSLEAAEPTAEEPKDAEPADWLVRTSIPIRQPEHWYERFRWFHTSDGFLVLGGRNAKQNEELVNKYTEPTDRVLHTQAHGGPMTVIKATDPSEPSREVTFPSSTLQQAAQFAVTYSSVWKDGHYAGDVYLVEPAQLSKQAESGEYLSAGGFAVRGSREYFHDTPVGCAIGITCEPETRVIGGPPASIADQAVTTIEVEPGRFAQADVAKRIYRHFRERFTDETFVRKIASPDQIQHFLPPGGSRIVE